MTDFWFWFNWIALLLFSVIPWGLFFGAIGLGVQALVAVICIPIMIYYEGF